VAASPPGATEALLDATEALLDAIERHALAMRA